MKNTLGRRRGLNKWSLGNWNDRLVGEGHERIHKEGGTTSKRVTSKKKRACPYRFSSERRWVVEDKLVEMGVKGKEGGKS